VTRFGNSDCSGEGELDVIPDVYGALRGLRSFKLDEKTGYLTGVYFTIRWTEGEQTARCLQTESAAKVVPPHVMYPLTNLAARVTATRNSTIGYDIDGEVATLRKGHNPVVCPGLARGDHGCGFYAQHGSKEPPLHYTQGVVEMYGQVELGPSGLRSSKAKLVALVRPGGRWSMAHRNVVTNDQISRGHEMRLSELLDEVAADEEAETRRVRQVDRTTASLLAANERARTAREHLAMWDSHTKWLYPNVPQYLTLDAMLAAHPVPSLDHLFEED
jgi:hypothetical protein